MLYNITDSRFSKTIKQLILLISLGAMMALVFFVVKSEATLPQQQITINVDIKNKVNICKE